MMADRHRITEEKTLNLMMTFDDPIPQDQHESRSPHIENCG